jgi:hypothetical protein
LWCSQPQSAGVLRRVHFAVHGHERGSFLASGAARLNHGHRCDHRLGLPAARPAAPRGAAAAACAHLRHFSCSTAASGWP